MNGEKNSVPRKQIAVTTAVNPVLPPASTPVADSMKAPEVDVPTKAAKITESASTVIGRSICGKFPFSSRNPARADTPISVPIESTKAIIKIVSTIGKNLQLSAPRKSTQNSIGERLEDKHTHEIGGGTTRVMTTRHASD